jgi:hypothetical protein
MHGGNARAGFAMMPWRMVGVTSSATNPVALF